jgi:hypothetical protein
MHKTSTLREKCLSIILLFAINENINAQENQIKYFHSKKVWGDKKILKLKNQKWKYNNCQLKIITETNETIKLKPYNESHSVDDIEIEIVVILKDKNNDKTKLYAIIEGEKHEIELNSNFALGGEALILNMKGEIFNGLKANHLSHCSHFSSNPTY